MVFSGLPFLLWFLPAVLLLYFLLRKTPLRNAVLCVFSLLFYAWGEPVYLILMLLMIAVNYMAAVMMDGRFKERKGARRALLAVSLVADLGSLAFFKYGDFVLINLESLFGLPLPRIGLALPIGISFYTFQIISYIADVYRGEIKAQKDPVKLTTYVCLFPQLVAGPIVRYQTIAEELDNRRETLPLFTEGLHRFIIGLGKKVVLANNMALIADTVFDTAGMNTGVIAWLGAAAYMLQIYFDFSGYSDMAIGMGKMFGFRFLENFNYPYIASSVTDFWRRWHISLSTWFRDYVYIPLGGNRVSPWRNRLNLFIVWMLTGLWHGAEWTFVLWGLYYFVLLSIEKSAAGKRVLDKVPKVLRHILTLLLVLLGWVIFRAPTAAQAFGFIGGMFTPSGTSPLLVLNEHRDLLFPLFLLLPAGIAATPLCAKLCGRIPEKVKEPLRTAFDVLLYFACIALLLNASYNPFIYFRF